MPRLSIIVPGRNDNYDGNFNERLTIALRRNIKCLPEAEFIFVEWNPYLDRPLTCSKLKRTFGRRIKYYVVHPKYHKYYCNIDGFLEYPPKNVGIRKAAGDFIVCTNSDVIFCPNLVNSMNMYLEKNILYRATRIDIRPDYLNVSFPLHPKYKLGENQGDTNAAGDFLLMHRDMWFNATGYCEEFPWQRLHKDAQIVHLLADRRGYEIRHIGSMTHWRHASSWSNNKQRGKVGDTLWDIRKCEYEKNKDTWGLTFSEEVEKDGITWLM
jgi:hypothetical protein